MTDPQANLLEVLDHLREAVGYLKNSFDKCQAIGINSKERMALVEFEALANRFARVTDILIHKVYRSIDSIEFLEGGTLIDVMNRAEKRKIIDSVKEMRILKDLRNDIAHEYLSEKIQLLHEEVLQLSPKLFDLANRALQYCHKYQE